MNETRANKEAARATRAGANLAPDRVVGRRTREEFLAERVGSSSDSRKVARHVVDLLKAGGHEVVAMLWSSDVNVVTRDRRSVGGKPCRHDETARSPPR
jgi:hypothetical protein